MIKRFVKRNLYVEHGVCNRCCEGTPHVFGVSTIAYESDETKGRKPVDLSAWLQDRLRALPDGAVVDLIIQPVDEPPKQGVWQMSEGSLAFKPQLDIAHET